MQIISPTARDASFFEMDLLQSLFDRPFLEKAVNQFQAEAAAIVESKLARPVLYEKVQASGSDAAGKKNAMLKPQTINEFRKLHADATDFEVQLGQFFETNVSDDAMWVLQYKFYTMLYLSDSLMAIMQQGSPKAVTDGFLRHFRAYFERHLCGVGSASKKKGVAKIMLVNTEPIDFVVSESLRLSRLYNAR